MKQFNWLVLCLLFSLQTQNAFACANLSFTITLPECQGDPLILTHTGINCSNIEYIIREWPLNGNPPVFTAVTGGNGSISVPANTFVPGQSYHVFLGVVGGGASAGSQTFTFPDLPTITPDFTINGSNASPVTVCKTSQPLSFVNTSVINNTTFGTLGIAAILWNMGDGNTYTPNSFSHTYASTGVYTVTLTITPYNNNGNLCPDVVITRQVYVSDCENGRICGRKFNDQNNNGVLDLNEQIINMPGWTIQLKDLQGNLIASTVTGSSGSYCFNNLTPGDYVVCEVNQSGWTQTFPSSPGTHTINLGADEKVYSVNFGNHKGASSPCNVDASYFVTNQNGCYLELSSLIAIGIGTQVLSIDWDFGDGTTATGGTASHHYQAAGNYEVCITVYAVKDGECCTDQLCETYIIDCERPPYRCRVEGDFGFTKSGCTYNFNGSTILTTSDVDVWFWDFGDGTTASGQNVTHTFSPGSYDICLTLLIKNGEGCCMDQVCKKIYIDECKPIDEFGSSGNRAPSTDQTTVKAFPGDLTIFPNPTLDRVHIQSDLEGDLTLRIFNLSGQVVTERPAADQQIQLQLSDLRLERGIYFVELSNSSDVARGKLIYQ